MTTLKNNFSQNTTTQYSAMFTHIVPVEPSLARRNDIVLKLEDVSYREKDAFAGILKPNYIFIDIDNKDGSTEGTKEWKKLLVDLDLDEKLGLRDVNTLVHSTKSGGFHLFFRLPEECDKKSLPSKLTEHVELKKKDAYLSGSTITVDGVTGKYEVIRDCEIMELPSSLVIMLLSKKEFKKKSKDKEESSSYKVMDIVAEGDNKVNWEDITYEDLKVKMETLVPDIDYSRWQRQMYLFTVVYQKLESLGKNLDISCEDFLINWSSRGINRGVRDRDDIKGMVSDFKRKAKPEDLLPENNYLIINYNSVTAFESYAKQFADQVDKLREESLPSGKIRAFVERYLDKLAICFVEDVMLNTECFVLDQDRSTNVYNFYAFTINNRWEKIISNNVSKQTRELLQLSTIYNILASEGKTLYSDNLRRHLAVILGNEELLNRFGQTLSFKLSSSLHRYDLSSKDFPFNTDVFGFKNIAIKVTKNPYSFKVISWEQVRALRLKREILMSTESEDSEISGDYFRKAIQFDPSVIRKFQETEGGVIKVKFDELEDELFTLFAPLFWDFTVNLPYSQSEEDFKKEVFDAAKDRMRTFFHLVGKSMLRYKSNIVPFIFIITGSEKVRLQNGANGKTFLGEHLLTSVFGMSRVTMPGDTASAENKDKHTEASLARTLLQVVDDLPDTGAYNQVSIRHLVKKAGARRIKTRGMGSIAKDVKVLYDTLVFTNNLNKNLGADGGNFRRLLKMELHNANRINIIRQYSSIEEMLHVHRQRYISFNPKVEEELKEHLQNQWLNDCYVNFFTLPSVSQGIASRALADNIYFTYLESLAEIFLGNNSEVLSLEQIRLKSLLFFYCISGGNLLLQLGSPAHLKGLVPFIVEDKSAPLYNILVRSFIFDTKFPLGSPKGIGLPLTRVSLAKMLKKTILTNILAHEDEINRFVQQVPASNITLPNASEPVEMLNLIKLDLGFLNFELSKNDNAKLEARVRANLLTDIGSVIEPKIDGSPYRKSNKTTEEKIVDLTKALGLKSFPELVELCKNVKYSDIENAWLKLYK